MYNKFETLAMESSIAVAVLGNADVTDIELLPISPKQLGAEKVNELARLWAFRDLRFIGSIGIVDGNIRTTLVEPLDERRISALSQAFIAYCETLCSGSIEEMRPKGDEAAWLRKLWSLPDTRMN